MARKRRLQSDSEGEEDPETQEESPQAKKKRVSSVKDADDEKTMDQDDFNCSQAPDFTVSTVSFCGELAGTSRTVRGRT